MKISEQNNLRVLLLAIALTILGGATGIMFYASQQNEAVLASESELLALKTYCPKGQHRENGKCVPDFVEPTDEEKCNAQEGKYWNKETGTCDDIKREPVCTDTQEKVNGDCVEKSTICKNDGGFWNEKTKECVHCSDNETYVNGVCIKKDKLACEENKGRWDETTNKCLPVCADDETLVGETCVLKKQISCEEQGWIWKDGECNPPECKEGETLEGGKCIPVVEKDPREEEREKCLADGRLWDDQLGCYDKPVSGDVDGDGIPDDKDDDIDGDGYLNDDDLDAWHYNVGDRDILMFATLAYEPVSASQDKIYGDTMTENGKTVKENYYENYETEPADTAETGYPDYFNYVCNGPRAVAQTAWNNAKDGPNPCMINEDQMIGMQPQSYNSELKTLIDAWKTSGKDFYFGDDGHIDGGADLYKSNYEARGLGEEAYKGYASIDEVNQWIIVDHTADHIQYLDSYLPNLSKHEGIMQATVFRLNNNFVIAYRGTDFPDIFDWFSDATYATNSIKGYEDAAKDYAKYIVETFSKEYFDNPEEYLKEFGGEPNFYITGHSLAGYLAPVSALGVIDSNVQGKEFLREVVYFNGMGVGLWGGNVFTGGERDGDFNKLLAWAQETDEAGALIHKVMCYNIYGDPVSALGRHVNQTGYYSAEGAIKYHSTEHVAFLQSATRTKISESFLNTFLWGNPLFKVQGDLGWMYNRLNSAKDYMEYYSDVYGDSFESLFKTTGGISMFDIFFFCHEPSASLFYNISQGTRGYEEQVHITTAHSGKTTTLTAEVNSDVESFAWYKDGVLISNDEHISFVPSELSNGSYSVSVIAKTRNSNKEIRKETIDGSVDIDESAPKITVRTENDIRNLRSGETIKFIVRAEDDSGFSDDSLSLNDISISGTILNKYLKIEAPVLLDESTDKSKAWSVSVTSSVAGTFVLKVKDGAFSDSSKLKSKEAQSSLVTYTIFEHKQDDRTKPTVKITPATVWDTTKGSTLNFRIEGYDENGFKNVNLKDNVKLVCTLGKPSIEFSEISYSDQRTAYATATVGCNNDLSLVPSYGYINVNSGAFVDSNDNKNLLKVNTTPIKFTAPADKTAPFIKITSIDGWKGSYGGSLQYTVTANDESGISDESTLEGNIEVLDGLRDKISIKVSEPSYNDNKTVVSYVVTVSTNENCSKTLGCGGTFKIKAGAFKDANGNASLMKISGNIVFASELDIVPPTVQIIPEGSRSAEIGDSLRFRVIAKDAGGIDPNRVLSTEDFVIVGKGNANIYVENVSEPKPNSSYTQVEYYVTVKGEDVSSNVQLKLVNGAIKDNAGNSSSSLLSEIIMFIKRRDLLPPTVTITPVTAWNAIKGNELKFIVKAKDEGGLSKNKTLQSSDLYMTKLITNDVVIKDVTPNQPLYNGDGTEASYIVTVYATKTGKSSLSVKQGAFKDVSGNQNLVKLSNTITYENSKDSTPPSVTITNSSQLTAKQDGTILLTITVSDSELATFDLKKDQLKIIGNDDIYVDDVYRTVKTNTQATWRVTIKNKGKFGFGQLVKDATLVVGKGLFKDGNNNQSPRIVSNLLRFTKY